MEKCKWEIKFVCPQTTNEKSPFHLLLHPIWTLQRVLGLDPKGMWQIKKQKWNPYLLGCFIWKASTTFFSFWGKLYWHLMHTEKWTDTSISKKWTCLYSSHEAKKSRLNTQKWTLIHFARDHICLFVKFICWYNPLCPPLCLI